MPSFPTLSFTPPGYAKTPQASEPLHALFPPFVTSYLSRNVVLDGLQEDATQVPFKESPYGSWEMTYKESNTVI